MNTKALVQAATVTIALIAVATIGSELSAALKQLLSLIGGHHWIGKSVLSIIFFGVLYLVFSRFSGGKFTLKDTWLLIGTVITSGLAILVFYISHAWLRESGRTISAGHTATVEYLKLPA